MGLERAEPSKCGSVRPARCKTGQAMALTLRALLLRIFAVHSAPLRGVRFFDYPDLGEIGALPHIAYFVGREAPYYSKVRDAMKQVARMSATRNVAFIETTTDYPDCYKFFNLHVEDSERLPLTLAIEWTFGVGRKPFKMYSLTRDGHPNASAMLDIANVDRFVQAFLAGTLEQWIRSEVVLQNLSDYSAASGAMQIVGSQFGEVVLENDLDVVVLFFAPWCGFSKRVQPWVDELARRVGHAPTVRVVKLDATMNDVYHTVLTKLSGYPFLAVFPAGAKDTAVELRAQADAANASEWLGTAMELLRQAATHPIEEASNATHAFGPSKAYEGLDRDIEEF